MKWLECVVARCAMGRGGSQEWSEQGSGNNSSWFDLESSRWIPALKSPAEVDQGAMVSCIWLSDGLRRAEEAWMNKSLWRSRRV